MDDRHKNFDADIMRATGQAIVQAYEAGLNEGAEAAQTSPSTELSPLALFFLDAVSVAHRMLRDGTTSRLYQNMMPRDAPEPLAVRSYLGSLLVIVEFCFAGCEDEISWDELHELAELFGIPADRIQAIREGTL